MDICTFIMGFREVKQLAKSHVAISNEIHLIPDLSAFLPYKPSDKQCFPKEVIVELNLEM